MSRDTEEPGFPDSYFRPSPGAVSSFDGTSVGYDVYDGPSRTVVLVVPGFWRDRSYPTIRHVALYLRRLGLPVAVADLRGHGDSEGRFAFNRFEHEDIAAVCRDLLLTSRYDRIVLLGFSMGGAIAVTTASRHDLPIAGLVLISPVSRLSAVHPRPNPFTIHRHLSLRQAFRRPRVARDVIGTDRFEAIDEIANVRAPVCLIHVKRDWLVHDRHSQALFDAAREPRELHLLDLPGQTHADRIFMVHAEVIEPIVEGFLRRVGALKG